MNTLLATVAEGEADMADILLLIAVIVFAVVAVLRFMRRAVEDGMIAIGLGLVALALMLW